MYELLTLELRVVVFFFVGEAVEGRDVLEKEFVDKGGWDIILPEDRFFEIEFVFLVKVVWAQLILVGTCRVGRLIVTLLATCNERSDVLLGVRGLDHFCKTHFI